MGKNFEVNIMMFGGRRSGKTSILAAMKECVDHVFSDEKELGLSISSLDFDTMKALEDKVRSSVDIMMLFRKTSRLHLMITQLSQSRRISLVFSL